MAVVIYHAQFWLHVHPLAKLLVIVFRDIKKDSQVRKVLEVGARLLNVHASLVNQLTEEQVVMAAKDQVEGARFDTTSHDFVLLVMHMIQSHK